MKSGPDAPRLVSLCPSLTETLFDIGAGGAVVGATRFCVRPADMPGVARVGGTKDPDVRRIVDLGPTTVFANREENRREDVEALRRAGVDVHTSMPRTVADVPPLVRDLGRRVGCTEGAERVASDVERALSDARVAAAARGRRTRFAVLVWRRPWMAATADTFLSDLLEQAGGENVLDAARGRYPEVTARDVARLRPECVLLPSEPFPFGRKHVDELAAATRFAPERFLTCDGALLTWHGSRTADGLRAATRWMDR